MGVVTRYDEIRDDLRDKVNECIKLALKLQDEDIWGYEDMNDEYVDNVLKILVMLQKVKKKI